MQRGGSEVQIKSSASKTSVEVHGRRLFGAGNQNVGTSTGRGARANSGAVRVFRAVVEPRRLMLADSQFPNLRAASHAPGAGIDMWSKTYQCPTPQTAIRSDYALGTCAETAYRSRSMLQVPPKTQLSGIYAFQLESLQAQPQRCRFLASAGADHSRQTRGKRESPWPHSLQASRALRYS